LNANTDLSQDHLDVTFLPVALALSSGRAKFKGCQNPNMTSLLKPDMDVIEPLMYLEGRQDPLSDFPVVGEFECDATESLGFMGIL
jgi:hypothetical protein